METHTHLSPFTLNQMAINGKIKLVKEEKLFNGFYDGTYYRFSTLEDEPIHMYLSTPGFGLGCDPVKLQNSFTIIL